MGPHGQSFYLHSLRLEQGCIGGASILVGGPVLLVLVVALVAVAIEPISGALLLLVLGAGTGFVGWAAWRMIRPVVVEVRPNGVMAGQRFIPRGEIIDCVLAPGGRLRLVIKATSGDWVSWPLDESIEMVEQVASSVRELLLSPAELAEERLGETAIRSKAAELVERSKGRMER